MLYQIHTYSNSTDTVDSVVTWLGEIQICLSNNPNVQFRVCNTIDSQNTKQLENYFLLHPLEPFIVKTRSLTMFCHYNTWIEILCIFQ